MAWQASCTRAQTLGGTTSTQTTAIHGETIENSLPGDSVGDTLQEPGGVVCAVMPWDDPLGPTVSKISTPRCTIILVPAEETPLRLAELCQEAGVPAGAINVVAGYRKTAGAALSGHPDV